mmetsp:Transcript_89273/g.142134  ORF Transcript_89273/g.142134 Transcript_89273/m.142134 type:complete len:93 (+) Transcript_89273:95-373(+)
MSPTDNSKTVSSTTSNHNHTRTLKLGHHAWQVDINFIPSATDSVFIPTPSHNRTTTPQNHVVFSTTDNLISTTDLYNLRWFTTESLPYHIIT